MKLQLWIRLLILLAVSIRRQMHMEVRHSHLAVRRKSVLLTGVVKSELGINHIYKRVRH